MTNSHRRDSKVPATRRGILLDAAILGSGLLGVKPANSEATTSKGTPPRHQIATEVHHIKSAELCGRSA
jgi:hypothetical protein